VLVLEMEEQEEAAQAKLEVIMTRVVVG